MASLLHLIRSRSMVFFFVNDTATTEIYTVSYTLSLHDALPICQYRKRIPKEPHSGAACDPAGRLQPLGRYLLDLPAVCRGAGRAGHGSGRQEVAPTQEVSSGCGAADRRQGKGAWPDRGHPGVGPLGGRLWATKGVKGGTDWSGSATTCTRRAGGRTPWPIRRAHRQGPGGRPQPQRVRPVVLGRGAAHGHLGAQGPRPEALGVAIRHGEDVRAHGRLGRQDRPTRSPARPGTRRAGPG